MASMYLSPEHFIQISAGRVKDTSHINKFGYNTAVGTSYETVTDLGTNNLPTSAAVVSIVSASTADTSAGTGARTVEIQGLDANYVEQTETVTMNGQSAVTTTATFIRVFRMRVTSAGTGETNAGNITASISSSDVARITAANGGQTLMAVYTVPVNKAAYLIKFQGSLSKNQEAQFQIRARKSGENAWNLKGLWGTFATPVNYDYPVPIKFTEKTDIQVRAKAGATSEIGAIFDLIVIDGPKDNI